MTKVSPSERAFNTGIVQRLGRGYRYGRKIYGTKRYGNEEQYNPKSEYGAKDYGVFLYGETDNRWGIYQRRHNQGKVIYVRMKFYIPGNPRTEEQQSWRAVFASGMTAWGNLTTNQKAVYNERAKKISLHGVNLFLREYLNSN